MPRFWALSLVSLALGVAGATACAEGPSPVRGRLASAKQAVINGQPDPGETGVVYISHFDFAFLCSGTVVHPQLVTTAKHCTFRERSGPDQPMAGDRFRIGFGPSVGNLTWRTSSKMEWIGMPGNVEVQPAVDAGEDIALLYINGAAPAGTKVHAVKLDYFPAAGDKIRIVGYGRSSLTSGASGVKLTALEDFNGLDAATGIIQTLGNGACSGDSGGAFFFGPTRELVGVTSTAGGSSMTSFCDVGISQATSVRNPNVNQFLFDALGALGTCVQQAEICGDGVDQDCDGFADNQCTPDGDPCTEDYECQNGLCQDIGGGGKECVRLCDEFTPCPASSRCVRTMCTAGYCEAGAQGTAKLLEACTADIDCATNHCSAEGCSTLCKTSLGECADGMACSTGACGECLDLASVPGPRQLGELCDSTADCDVDGECVDDTFGIKRCAMPCFEEHCPGGFQCRAGMCIRTGGFSNGDRCLDPNDCGSFLCALITGDPSRNFCTKPCATAAECGAGFDCLMQFGQMICVPDGLYLGEECVADSQCTSRDCDDDLGVCTRPCDPTTVGCPPGFTCEVRTGDLKCVPGPGAWPDPPEPGPEAGMGGAGTAGTGAGGAPGGQAGTGGSTTAGTSNGSGASTSGSGDSGDDSGCGCRVAGDARPAPTAVWAALAGLVLATRRRRRQSIVRD